MGWGCRIVGSLWSVEKHYLLDELNVTSCWSQSTSKWNEIDIWVMGPRIEFINRIFPSMLIVWIFLAHHYYMHKKFCFQEHYFSSADLKHLKGPCLVVSDLLLGDSVLRFLCVLQAAWPVELYSIHSWWSYWKCLFIAFNAWLHPPEVAAEVNSSEALHQKM